MIDKRLAAGIIIAIIVTLVSAGAVFFNITGYAVCKPIEHNELVPQLDLETFQVLEEKQVPLTYRVTQATNTTEFYLHRVYAIGQVYIKNIDDQTGIFTVVGYFETDTNTTVKSVTFDLLPREVKLFYFEYLKGDFDHPVSFRYEVQVSNKTLSKEVTEYRNITRYVENKTMQLECLGL